MPRKRSRMHLRIAPGDVALIRAAAQREDMSVSEFVRRASLARAVEVVHGDIGRQPAPTADSYRAA